MFDIGFAELLIVGVVGLVVLGPEKLPTAARTVGLWVGRIRRSVGSIQREINEELRVDELKRTTAMSKDQLEKELGDVTESFQRPFGEDSPAEKAAPEAPKTDFDPTSFTSDPSVHEAYKPTAVAEENAQAESAAQVAESDVAEPVTAESAEQLADNTEQNEPNKHSS
ncbi:MAG: Sec-independent protein translocase protein TatB [Marinobacterium sp. xm-d-530]|jgi:sec-independent protein translocase protein TatB|nr:MAG: Sec-independent protein translocase protein TatB [Marinobacterium sp. xm-d-530]